MKRIRALPVFNLTFLIICLISSCYSVDLEPYGPPIDADLHCHACSSGNVLPAGQAINFFGETYTEMFVSSNGIISLGCDAEDELSFNRVPMIAPYLSDIDTRLINNAAVDGTVFYRTEVGDDVSFDTWVLDHFGIPFLTSYEVIATFDHVKEINQTSSARNTFQVIVYASAYGDTAVCFNYPTNGLNWPDASNPPISIYPIAGFYSGSDLNIAYYLPGSGTAAVSNLDDLAGNFGVAGQFCYLVNSLEVISDCTIDALYCRPPSFFPINTPLDHTDVLSYYSLCNNENLTIDTSSFSCSQLGELIPVTATIGPLSCVSYFIPVIINKFQYINCPSDIQVYSNVPTTVSWQPPTLTGDCPSGHAYSNYQPDYSLFPVGTTQVTYHAYDINYSPVYCQFEVTVQAHVTINYHVIDVMNRPISGAAIGGNPDCSYTDVYGYCSATSPSLLVGDFIPAGYYYVNFNGNIYAIPHGDITINCLNVDVTLIISPPGFYRSTSGDIIGCGPGTYSTSYEATECFPCTSGTYNNDYYQTSCEACPLGYYSASGATECFTCYAGYYLDQYSGSCQLCPAGSYSCDRSVSCEACPVGSWSAAGSADCTYCTSGYYLDQYSNLCTICPANTYSSDRATVCTQCPEGYYAPPGSSYCSACNAGYYLDLSNYQCLACPTGYYSCDRALECTPCAPGGFSAPGSSSCSFCYAGYYRNLDDTACSAPPCGCSPCPAGTYSCDRADVCEACPAGSWSTPGSSSCYSCTAGYYLDTQTGSCLTCPANTYSLDRAITCTACPEGSYSAGGATECTFCLAGYYYNNYTGSCELCPANTYSAERATECTPCPIGGYSFEGSIECSFCSAGYYLDSISDICQPCAAGTYSCDRAISCEVCGDGSYSYPGSSSCTYCSAGYYFDQYAQLCLPCSAGSFSADRASICTLCPVGYYSQPGSASCYSCTAGYYLDVSTGQCIACPSGFTSSDRAIDCYPVPVNQSIGESLVCTAGFYLEAATNSCLPCPPNTFSADAATQCTPCPYGSASPMASSSCTFCSAGYYLDVGLSNCFPCPANYFSPDRSTQCFPCPFNSYSSVGSGSCSPCPNGTYLNSFGSCQLCAADSFFYQGVCVPCAFSFASDSCPFCPPGYESDLVCNECCEGYYSPDGNTCLPCPAGSYSGPGYSSCVYCAPGEMWDDNRHVCYPCDT